MAKSFKDKVAIIKRRREKAEAEIARAMREEEELVGPFREEVGRMFAECVDHFARNHIEMIHDANPDRGRFAALAEAMLFDYLGAKGKGGASRTTPQGKAAPGAKTVIPSLEGWESPQPGKKGAASGGAVLEE